MCFIDVVLLLWEELLWEVLLCIAGNYYLMGELLIHWEEVMGEVVLCIVRWDLSWEELRREVLRAGDGAELVHLVLLHSLALLLELLFLFFLVSSFPSGAQLMDDVRRTYFPQSLGAPGLFSEVER